MIGDQIERVQRFESENEHWVAALLFVREVVKARGHPLGRSARRAEDARYSDEKIMEMIATVALATLPTT
jgi:hypothetical protein